MRTLFPATCARLEAWGSNPDVLGVVQVGSKSRGHADERSDDDLEIVLAESAFATLAPHHCHEMLVEGDGPARRLIYDAQLLALSDYRRKLDSAADLDHWPYERAIVHLDRDGRIADAVGTLAAMPAAFRATRLQHAFLDAWTGAGRAAVTALRGHEAGHHLLVARSARAMTRLVFALEWRWAPLEHWWQHELATLSDPHGVRELMVDAVRGMRHEPLLEALTRLDEPLAAEGVPGTLEGRRALFLTVLHASHAAERARHATV